MAEINKPTDLNKIWASAGAIVVPDDTKISTGWIVEAPPHQTENYINHKHDTALAYLNQHGIPQWDANTEYHANKSWVQGSNGSLYYAKQNHVNQNPITDTTENFWNLVLQGTGVVHKADTTTFSRTWLANSDSAATGRSQLGSTSVGDSVFTASTVSTARTALGATSVGSSVFTAASALAARTAIGVNSASDTAEGIVERATDAEVITGTDDVRFITPKKLKLGFSVQLAPNGYFKFPTWLGGLVLNWKRAYVPNGGSYVEVNWETPFPNECWGAIVDYHGGGSEANCWVEGTPSQTAVRIDHNSGSGKTLFVLGIGY